MRKCPAGRVGRPDWPARGRPYGAVAPKDTRTNGPVSSMPQCATLGPWLARIVDSRSDQARDPTRSAWSAQRVLTSRRRIADWLGVATLVGLLAGGYIYNLTLVQLGLPDFATRVLGLSSRRGGDDGRPGPRHGGQRGGLRGPDAAARMDVAAREASPGRPERRRPGAPDRSAWSGCVRRRPVGLDARRGRTPRSRDSGGLRPGVAIRR